jgi:hypothetical protein
MALITNIAPTTELEAVNSMLSALGEAPVSDLAAAAASLVDVQMGISLLRNATREVQSNPWRFNYEPGLQVAPVDTILWTDATGTATLLNVFQAPTGVSAWRMTKCGQNTGLDLVERPAKQYTSGGVKPLVLYDRSWSRDGANAASYPYIYIDALYHFDFEQMPETARRLVTVMAGRRFAQQIVGSAELAGFATGDEQLARRLLMRDQGDQTELNMLDTYEAFGMMGERGRDSGFWAVVRPGSGDGAVLDLSTIRGTD